MEQNTPRVTNPRRLAVVGGLALVLSLALLFSARAVIREAVVLPLSYLVWSIGVFLETTPQFFFWVAVLLMTGLAAYRSLVGRRKALADDLPDLNGSQYARPLQGQAARWAAKVNLLRQGQSQYFQNSFHQSVGRLLMDTLSYRYHLTPAQIEEQLREGVIELPPAVREYALASLRREEMRQPGVFSRYWSALVDLFRSWFAPRSDAVPPGPGPDGFEGQSSAEEQRVQVVLKYIED